MGISSVFAALVQTLRTGVFLTVATEVERKLLDAAATGYSVDLRTGNPASDNPANAANWDDDRIVQAKFLADLVTGELATSTGCPILIRLGGARISGTLDLEARKLVCPLLLEDCRFTDAIDLSHASAIGIILRGCHVPGLDARRLQTSGTMELTHGFTAPGGINLYGAHIGSDLLLSGAKLTNEKWNALKATNITVEQDMRCNEGFSADGGVILNGARIGGTLEFSDARLINENGKALNATGITVKENMVCDKLTARGEINLTAAHIGMVLNFSGASLVNGPGNSLNAMLIDVGLGIFCSSGFMAQGTVQLTGAKSGYAIYFREAALNSPGRVALDLEEASTRELHMPETPPTGRVNLVGTKIQDLVDYEEGWPEFINLRGFTYNNFHSLDKEKNYKGISSISTHSRLQWLGRHPGRFTPQIYDQLADVYQRAGDDGAARKVAVAKQWRRRKPYNPLSWLWWVTVGYGYRTWQAFIWAAALAVIGSLVFSGAYPVHMIALNAHPPRFQPIIYSLDVLLPIGGLGQKSTWQATGGFLSWYWVLTIAGWVLSAAVVAGLTGILKRD